MRTPLDTRTPVHLRLKALGIAGELLGLLVTTGSLKVLGRGAQMVDAPL